MKTICIYCTRTGITKKIAEDIAAAVGAELSEITDGKARRGVFGFIGGAVVGLRKKLPELLPLRTERPLEEYDRVIVLAPVWCETLSPIARAFLTEEKSSLKGELDLVITHMSDLTYEEPVRKFTDSVGLAPKHFLSVKTKNHVFSDEVKGFIEELK